MKKKSFTRKILPLLIVAASLAIFVFGFLFPNQEAMSGTGSAVPAYGIVEESGQRSAEFTLLTYNVKICRNGTAIKQVAAQIAETGAQIVFLQEIDYRLVRSFFTNQAKRLAAELDFHYAYFPALKAAGGLYGTAILSAFPLSNVNMTQLPVVGDIEPRAMGQADITVEGISVRLFVTHLSAGSPESRLLQFAEMRRAIDAAPSGSFIFGGDFNERDNSVYAILGDVEKAHWDDKLPHYPWEVVIEDPSRYPSKIDNIFTDTSKRLFNTRILPHNGLSDHNLVLTDVSIPLGEL